MLTKHSAPVWPEGHDRIILDTVDSTMAEAARRAPELTRPTWIMAKTQSSARGRQGRAWQHPDGNLAVTLLMHPGGSVMEAAQRSFFAANALYGALALYTDCAKLGLKWPNDVLLSGGKVAGILLESTGNATGVDWLAVGFGVNLQHVPDAVNDASFPPVCLADHGESVAPEDFLTALAAHFEAQETMFAQQGFEAIRDNWLSRAARLGEVITARTERDEITGVFESVDASGNLILRTAKGPQMIPAADVYF